MILSGPLRILCDSKHAHQERTNESIHHVEFTRVRPQRFRQPRRHHRCDGIMKKPSKHKSSRKPAPNAPDTSQAFKHPFLGSTVLP
jgi:hypothetical protein